MIGIAGLEDLLFDHSFEVGFFLKRIASFIPGAFTIH
jgi:hypothetical protein